PGRADVELLIRLQRIREINDGAAGGLRLAPMLAGEGLIAGKKCQINIVEAGANHGLNEGRLFADGLELAEQLVVIEQSDLTAGKISLFQQVLELFALERSRPEDGDLVEAAPASRGASCAAILFNLSHRRSKCVNQWDSCVCCCNGCCEVAGCALGRRI